MTNLQHVRCLALMLCINIIVPGAGIAQRDAISALKKMSKAYHQQHAIRFKGTLRMYLKEKPGKTIEQMESEYLLHGSNFTCSIGPVTVLLNEKYYVSIDNSVKIIMIGYKKDLSGTEHLPVVNIHRFQEWIIGKKMQATVISYGNTSELELKDLGAATGYSQYNIFYDERTGYMKSVQLETSDHNDLTNKIMILEISYTTPVAAVNQSGMFSENKFFSIVHKKIQVKNHYKTYQLINQL